MPDNYKPLWDTVNKHSHLIAEVDKKTDLNAMRIDQQEARHDNLMQQVVKSEGKMDAKQDELLAAVSTLGNNLSTVHGQMRTIMWGVPITMTIVSIVAGATYAITKLILGS